MLLGVVLGALLLTIQPLGAQNVITHSAEVKEHSTDAVRLAALEPDRTQVSDRWELVTDDNDPAGGPSTTDHRLFQIDRSSGVLTFKSPPDYENPMGAAADTASDLAAKNVYEVRAKFGDGEKYLAVNVTVTVTGIEEDGTITLSNRRPEVGEGLTATLADPDKGIRTPDWQWQVETGEGTGVFEDIPNAVNRTYTPKAGDVGKYLKATADYQDGHDVDVAEEYAVSDFVVRAAPGSNVAPMFREKTDTEDVIETSRRIEENSAPGMKVGPAVYATDNNHVEGVPRDEITYSLRDPTNDPAVTGNDATTDDDNDPNTDSAGDGQAALFSIDQETGQITTKAHLSHESLDRTRDDDDYRYIVVVRATDPSGEYGEATLTIHVLDEDETPQLTGPAALTYFENRPVASTAEEELILHRDPETDVNTNTDQVAYMAADNDLDDDATVAVGNIQWELTGPDASKFCFADDATDSTCASGTYTNSATLTNDVEETVIADRDPAMATSPVLRFRSAPDVESPGDVAGTTGDNIAARARDNIYEITVRAWDGDWLIGSRNVTIRVADTDDDGKITLSHIRPQQGVDLTATLNDPDGVSGAISWQWYTGGLTDGEPTGTAIDGATKATFTPPESGDGNTGQLSVKATYEDRGSTGQERTATAETDTTGVRTDPITDDTGENTDPTFYKDAAVDSVSTGSAGVLDDDERTTANETSSYTRYVLEGQIRSVRNKENAEPNEDDGARGYVESEAHDAAAAVKVWDGYYADEAAKATDPPTLTADGTNGANLQFDLSGTGAENFEINQNPTSTANPAGLIKTKRKLDFETRSTYTLTLTATDPHGASTSVTVTINVLDQAEIEDVPGDEKRVWVNEALNPTTEIVKVDDLRAANPPDISLGGLKWSLLTVVDPDATPSPLPSITSHNRDSVLSVDCQPDSMNQGLCDDFRFSNFNTATTQLLFAIGTGETHNAPDFEDPKDIAGRDDSAASPPEGNATDQAAMDNIYQVRVRVAFATLRSDGTADHPNPASDEMSERTYVVRVVDVDEAPSFVGTDSDQSIDENSDDDPIVINRDLGGSVTAMDPEDTTPDPNKKLTFSLSLPDAYADMFDIVPSTGEIVTRRKIDYEALDLEEQGIPGGQYKTITGATVTVMDSVARMRMLGNNDDMPMMGLSDSLSATLPVSINIRDLNETPVEAEPLAISGDAAVSDYAENQEDTTVGTYTVAGDNEDTARWSLGGYDMGQFTLEGTGTSRTLKFASAPDFEAPADADGDNVYMVSIMATHDADDTNTMDVTITVTDVEELGTLISPTISAEYAENDTADLGIFSIEGAGADSVVWSLGGTDADDFSINGGVLAFGGTPDFENPADSDGDNTYMVTVKAMAGGEMEMEEVSVMVTDVNELGTLAGIASHTYAENGTGAVDTYTLSGGTMDSTADWSVEGADAGAFSISGGTLSFSTSPDYEAMADADGDNTYMVKVKAMAGGEMEMMDVSVMVTDVNELGTLAGDASHTYAENGTGAVGTYTLSDGSMDSTADWSVEGADAGAFSISGGTLSFSASPDYEAMADADGDNTYMVKVKAMAGGEMEMMDVSVMVTDANDAPMFAQATAERSIAENSDAGMYIGDPVTATDEDEDTLTYTLSGMDAASFDIDSATGQLMTKAALDYETKRSYSVTVTATDGDMAPDTIDVTINVTDVAVENLAPTFTDGATATRSVDENSAAGMDVGDPVMATDEDGDTVTYTLDGTDAASFDINSATGQLMTKAALDYETKSSYSVTVTATDDSGEPNNMDSIDVTINVTNVDETGMLELSTMSPTVRVALTATLTDPDGSIASVDWQWSRSPTMDGTFTHIDEETMTYTPTAGDVGRYLKVVARYTDGHGPGKDEEATTGKVSAAPDPVLLKFDTNKNGSIDRSEAIAALRSYRAGEATRSEAIAVLRLYRDN